MEYACYIAKKKYLVSRKEYLAQQKFSLPNQIFYSKKFETPEGIVLKKDVADYECELKMSPCLRASEFCMLNSKF